MPKAIKILRTLLATMKVPEDRLDDYEWLYRNIEIKNKDHLNLPKVMSVLKVLTCRAGHGFDEASQFCQKHCRYNKICAKLTKDIEITSEDFQVGQRSKGGQIMEKYLRDNNINIPIK